MNSLVMEVGQIVGLLVPCRSSFLSAQAAFRDSLLLSILKHLDGVLGLTSSFPVKHEKMDRDSHSLGLFVFIYLGALAINYIPLYNLSSWVKSCNLSLLKNITDSNMVQKYFIMLIPFPFLHSNVGLSRCHMHQRGENTEGLEMQGLYQSRGVKDKI